MSSFFLKRKTSFFRENLQDLPNKYEDEGFDDDAHAALTQYMAEDAARAITEQREMQRKENSLLNRLKRNWQAICYLTKVLYTPDRTDLAFLAYCLQGQNLDYYLDYYEFPTWLAPTWLTAYQRQLMIEEAGWLAEGSLNEQELLKLDEQNLAIAYLGSLHDYCVSQGII